MASVASTRCAPPGRALDDGARVREHACEMLVSLAEEGWTSGDIALRIIERYLDDATDSEFEADSIILGCTHFPLLEEAIRQVAGEAVVLVDSARTTAVAVQNTLARAELLRGGAVPGEQRFLATDGATRFARVGGQFLGHALTYADVEIVDL